MQTIFITSLFLKNAFQLSRLAQAARTEGMIEKEIRLSIGAHLMAAICLESAINEVAQTNLSTWAWEKLEKTQTAMKWYVTSHLVGRKPFEPGVEPMQTVEELQKTRNLIAHPKAFQHGTDMIVRHMNGSTQHNVSDDHALQNQDMLFLGYGKLREDYNADKATRSVQRAHDALLRLKESLNYSGFEWLADVELDV